MPHVDAYAASWDGNGSTDEAGDQGAGGGSSGSSSPFLRGLMQLLFFAAAGAGLAVAMIETDSPLLPKSDAESTDQGDPKRQS